MNFIEAVKKLENDYSHMYIDCEFNKRLKLEDGKLRYVEPQIYDISFTTDYTPTANHMLREDWFVTSDEIVDGIRLNDLKDKTIKNIEYIDEHIVVTLCNGKKYEISGYAFVECSDAVTISEITGE